MSLNYDVLNFGQDPVHTTVYNRAYYNYDS